MAKFHLLVVTVAYLNINAVWGKCSPATIPSQRERFGTTIHGTSLKSRGGREICSYLGLPFAEKPKLFQPPEPFRGFTKKTYQAKEAKSACLQLNALHKYAREGSTDCLYLNVYTTDDLRKLPTLRKKPVMVWFHGGAFMWGNGAPETYGPSYLSDYGVVIVVVQYRLGSLGFLSTGDAECPGNNGLKDQNMALRWVRNNIAYFGGDPTKVTIFGQSAGGSSVHAHYMSPLSKGLFQRAIAMSGDLFMSWGYDETKQVVNTTAQLAKYLGCPNTTNSKEIMRCLRSQKPEDIVDQHIKFMPFDMDYLSVFGPTVEKGNDYYDRFIPDDPYILIRSGLTSKVPFALGTTSGEGVYLTATILHSPKTIMPDIDKDYLAFLTRTLDVFDVTGDRPPNNVSDDVLKYYFGQNATGDDLNEGNVEEMNDMYGDRQYFVGSYESACYHMDHGDYPVYWYKFAYEGNFSITYELGEEHSTEYMAVCHADDLQFLWPSKADWPDVTGDDETMSHTLIKYYTNFAKSGDPNRNELGRQDVKYVWKPLRRNAFQYFKLLLEPYMTDEAVHYDRMQYWCDLKLQDSGKPENATTACDICKPPPAK